MSYERLSSGIRDMSKQLPATAAQIAKVAEVSGQLGISADNVLGFTKVMIDMGESTNLSAEDAASAIAKIANITGMSADQYQRFGSSVVALGKNYCSVGITPAHAGKTSVSASNCSWVKDHPRACG